MMQSQRSELGATIHQNEIPVLVFNMRVKSGHTDVIDSEVALMTSAQGEFELPVVGDHRVNDSGGVLLQVQGFQNNVVI